MKKVLIVGAGKIGTMIAQLLLESKDYTISLIDRDFSGASFKRLRQYYPDINAHIVDVSQTQDFDRFLSSKPHDAVISCLPFYLTLEIAKLAKRHEMHYFDLTEDVQMAREIRKIAKDSSNAFVPQCGLAPGYIGLRANDLMQGFDTLDIVKLRVGALPVTSSHALKYALNWSIDGLVNEYLNPCHAIHYGDQIISRPLEELETIQIDGFCYEAFNTSGGIGSLAELYMGKVQQLNYKTIRYPGHCDKIRFLLYGLGLSEDRMTLKKILQNSVPTTYQDTVLIYVSVSGYRDGSFIEKSHVEKIYAKEIAGLPWSAIQISTASGVCSILDLVFANEKQYQGLVLQEQFALSDVLNNRFGQHFSKE